MLKVVILNIYFGIYRIDLFYRSFLKFEIFLLRKGKCLIKVLKDILLYFISFYYVNKKKSTKKTIFSEKKSLFFSEKDFFLFFFIKNFFIFLGFF